jgi:uncharacterized membrane protein
MSNGQQWSQPQGWGSAPGPQGGHGQAGYQPGAGFNPYPQEDVETGKALAIVGYLVSPLWIIPLVQRDNAFALFHAKQAMVYSIFMCILGAVIGAASFITCGFGAVFAFAIFPFMYPWIMAIVYAAQGEYRPMPWIGGYADQYFGSIVADRRPPPRGF